jgi:biofilm PGA synthesis N-glycosyltransferase PgaC
MLNFLFWFSLCIVFYSYAGYGMLLFFLVQIKRLFHKTQSVADSAAFEPEVALVVAAFNEEDFIEKKIQNTFMLDYPHDKLKLFFITDGSSDQTGDIVDRYSDINHLHQPERRGKVAAMNRAMQFVRTPFVIFSDANTLLNSACIKNMVRHYREPFVGGVAGEKKIISAANDQAAGVGEGLYWKYESFLKKLDSELYSVVGAAGELFSTRTELFERTREDIIIEDFVQSLTICMKGYVIRYEPQAYAMETSSVSMKEEEKRKIRICAGAFQAMLLLKGLFNVFKYPLLSFQFISHRVLRWTLAPVCLVLFFISNGILCLDANAPFYCLFFVLQLGFYLCALVGWFYANRNVRIKALYLPYYFLFMNISVFMGFSRFLKKNQTVLWERASRRNP